MTTYAQLPGSQLILPDQLARSVMHDYMFGGRGAYRSTSPSNKNTAGWRVSLGSADADSLPDMPTLRGQSSDLLRNEALAVGVVNNVTSAAVGTGIQPQSRIDHEFLGITEQQAAEFEARAEMIFSYWADDLAADSERAVTHWEQQELALRSEKERGDVFLVRRYKERPGRLLSICWQMIEADRVTTPYDRVFTDRNIREGIEYSPEGEKLAVHIMQSHPGDMLSTLDDRKFTRLPFFDDAGQPLVLHHIKVKRIGQTRGIPYLAPVVELLKQLGRYTEAEVTAAVVSSFLSVVVTSPAAGTAGSPIQSMQFNGGLPGVVGGGQPLPQGNKVSKLQSGVILDLAPGEDVKVVEAVRPNTAYDPFVMSLLRQIGSALELPFEVLIKHFTASYSASRAALLEAWRFFLIERARLVARICQPVWESVITEAVARGLLDAPGFFDDPLMRRAWLTADWVGQQAPQIDPVKEATAAKLWNDLGIQSRQDIAAAQGRDFDRTLRRRAKEKRMLEEAGLGAPEPASAQQPDDQQQDNSDGPPPPEEQ